MTEYDLTAMSVPLPEDVQKCKLAGDLEGAKRLIERRLEDKYLGGRLKERLALEKLALERLPGEYPLSRAQALAQLKEEIPDFTEAEFDALEEAGWIDFYYIEGEKRYFCAFCASLLVAHPEIAARAGKHWARSAACWTSAWTRCAKKARRAAGRAFGRRFG